MITKKSEDAVSPVIGIMLLVVVTVIIAAVITAFATGVVGSTEPAPVAALDVEILNSENTLSDLSGPELFITHRSGDAVDTKDIELRFSWVCGLDDCESGGVHYSTYSADGFKEAHPDGIDSKMNKRYQALYVKSTAPTERTDYKSKTTGELDNYFGDVILTPGLKLSASSELLSGSENTQSQFMEMVFNNYHNSIEEKGEYELKFNHMIKANTHLNYYGGWADCEKCNPNNYNDDDNEKEYDELADLYDSYSKKGTPFPCGKSTAQNVCINCNGHTSDECSADKNCPCVTSGIVPGTEYKTGIMDHLPAGTAVDVMIVHLPSDKAIFDKTVIVQ